VASEKNPLAEYLTEKKAFGGADAGSFGGNMMAGLKGSLGGRALGGALGGAAMAGGVGLAGLAAQKVMDAMTKANDFKQMLAYDAELAQMHQEDPRLVNQMFSTLRTFNPGFTKDPVVASSYVKKMVDGAPTGVAGSVATEALSHRDQLRPAVPLGQMMLGKAMGGGAKKR